MKELKDLDVQVYGTVSLGCAMMEDMLLSRKKEQRFKHRMDKLEQEMKMMWQLADANRCILLISNDNVESRRWV